MPPPDAMAAGAAGLRLKLTAKLAPSPAASHLVALTATHGHLIGWFIRACLHPDLADRIHAVQIEGPAAGRVDSRIGGKGR